MVPRGWQLGEVPHRLPLWVEKLREAGSRGKGGEIQKKVAQERENIVSMYVIREGWWCHCAKWHLECWLGKRCTTGMGTQCNVPQYADAQATQI